MTVNCVLFPGAPRERVGALEADDGPTGGGPVEEPDAGEESPAKEDPPRDASQRNDVQRVHADIHAKHTRDAEADGRERTNQKGLFTFTLRSVTQQHP